MNEYDTFVKHEQEFGKNFLKQKQVLDDRYDENDYIVIKNIWKDKSLINNIYQIIDDIINIEKIERKIRFLMIGDFLFSLTSNDLSDPAEFVMKTTRNAYITRIRLRAIINTLYGCDYETYIIIHQKLLIGLRIEDIIKRNTMRSVENNVWNTVIYFQLKTKIKIEKHPLGECKLPYVVMDIGNTKYSVGSFRNIWKIKRKKREMEDFTIPYNTIIIANQI